MGEASEYYHSEFEEYAEDSLSLSVHIELDEDDELQEYV
jgi:hypothetical protein